MVSEGTIHFIFRKQDAGFHSIETVFGIIVPLIGAHYNIRQDELKHGGGGPADLHRNLRSFKKGTPGTPEDEAPGTPEDGASRTLFHITGHVNYMAIKTGRTTVLTIHDIRSALKGNIFARLIKLLLWFWIPALVVRRITVISSFSLGELRKLVPFVVRKAVVIPNPVHPGFVFDPAGRMDIPNGELFYPPSNILLMGTKPNKNLERMVEALKELPVKLTIVGQLSAAQLALLNKTRLVVENHVDITHDRLVQCYRDADMLCFASLYEGFGMPIIEAQATGRPVVTSGRGAMKEVAGEGALLVDPEDVASIREGVVKIMEDAVYRQQLVERGLENVKRYRAEVIAEKYMEVYKEVLGTKQGKELAPDQGKEQEEVPDG